MAWHWCGLWQAKGRNGGGAGVEMCGGRCAVWGALVRRCVEEGALRRGAGVWVWKGASTLNRGRGSGAMGVYVGEWVGANAH